VRITATIRSLKWKNYLFRSINFRRTRIPVIRHHSYGSQDAGDGDDPGSVEVQVREMSPGDSNIERQPINKVRESILRLEIENLKKGR